MKLRISYPIVFFQLFILAIFFYFSVPAFSADLVLDAESTRCLKCHEGGLKGNRVCHRGGCDHPIGVDYAAAARRNPSLPRASTLDPALRLIDGRIGCLTCHVPFDSKNHLDLYAKRVETYEATGVDNMLSVDNNASRLCMSCHRK